MPLTNINGETPEDNKANVEGIQRTKADKAQMVDRAPVASDPFSECWQYAKGGTNLKHWKRHPVSGAWYSATYS